MNKDIVKHAVICLSHLEIEDTTYKIARDIVIEEYEHQKEEIERLNNIINELENILVEKLDAINYIRNTFGEKARVINPDINGIEMGYKDIQSILKELKGDSSNE